MNADTECLSACFRAAAVHRVRPFSAFSACSEPASGRVEGRLGGESVFRLQGLSVLCALRVLCGEVVRGEAVCRLPSVASAEDGLPFTGPRRSLCSLPVLSRPRAVSKDVSVANWAVMQKLLCLENPLKRLDIPPPVP